MTSLLPPPTLQYCNANGAPYAAGLLHTFVPGTTTPASTWQDAGQVTLNTNPIVLDSAGRCVIYGSGQYRLQLFDALGNLIFDKLTQSTDLTISSALIPVVTASTTAAALAALGISAWAVAIIENATQASGWNAFLSGGGYISGNPSISFAPVGNGFTTLGSVVQQSTAQSSTLREFAGSFGLESHVGLGGSNLGIAADKVALYAGIEGFAGSADIWAYNSVTNCVAGFPATANALGSEIDYNNNAQNIGAPDGLSGFAAPIRFGLLITGASTFSSTAALSVQGPSNTQWYRGIGVADGVSECAFYDYSTGTAGLEMQATHAWGIDMNGSALTGAIRLPNNSPIMARNNATNADIAAITVNAGNNVLIGTSAGGGNLASGVYMGAGVVPFVTNVYTLGTAGNIWTSVYATTGVVSTSDPRLKTDISPIASALSVVNQIQPITYKWKVGGYDQVDTVESQTVHDSEQITTDSHEIVVKDGTATKVPVSKTITTEAWDTVPLLDEAGKPIMVHVPARPEWTDSQGKVHPARDACDIPETHRVPRMVTKDVTVTKQVERPGKRLHAGFSADDVEKIAGLLGIEDFAGYVLGEDGTKHMRSEQMIPILWQAVRELSAEVEALKAR